MYDYFDYDEAEQDAIELIEEFGGTRTNQAYIIRNVNSGPDYNPVITPTNHNCTVVTLDISLNKIDGTLVQVGDQMAYVSTDGLSIVPTTADKLVVQTLKYEIVTAMPLSPAGKDVYYKLLIRGGTAVS